MTEILTKVPSLPFIFSAASLIEKFVASSPFTENNISPVFAVLCKDDAYRAERMARMTGGKATKLLTPSELQQLLSEARGAIGTRLHFLIFALMAGLPVFALSLDEKGRYLTEYVNTVQKGRMTFGHALDERLGIRLSDFIVSAMTKTPDTFAAENIHEATEIIPPALL